jgi:hypothetical protein
MERRTVWIALAATLLASGIAAFLWLAGQVGEGNVVPAWGHWLPWALTMAGLLLFLLLLTSGLARLIWSPVRQYRVHLGERRTREARYEQRLRCAKGHEFTETVRWTPEGWLEHEGATRTCPTCGDSSGFTSGGSEPLNRAARKLGPL